MSNNGTMNINSPSSSSNCFLSGRNKLRISLDVASDVDKRWSDVVPPNSALTFAALWDPNDGMVTFSGAHLLDLPNECESSSGVATFPDIFDDDVSETVSHEHTSESEESAATTVASQDAPKAFLHRVPRNSKFHKQHPNTLASPALDRLDVYPRDPHVSLKHQSSVHRSVMVDEKSSSKTQAVVRNLSPESDDVSDEGFFEDISAVKGRTELKSHWSATTTSTSAYAEVPYMSKKTSERQNRIPHPLWIADKDQPVLNPTTPPKTPRRRLKKRRPSCLSSSSHSSDGSGYTSPVSPDSSPISPSGSLQSRRSRRLTRAQKDDSWVCIEITPFITQRVVVGT